MIWMTTNNESVKYAGMGYDSYQECYADFDDLIIA
jgi:hypothetical protein